MYHHLVGDISYTTWIVHNILLSYNNSNLLLLLQEGYCNFCTISSKFITKIFSRFLEFTKKRKQTKDFNLFCFILVGTFTEKCWESLIGQKLFNKRAIEEEWFTTICIIIDILILQYIVISIHIAIIWAICWLLFWLFHLLYNIRL